MKNLNKAAPPLELVLKGGDPEKVALWCCGTCKLTARSKDEAIACCAPFVCETCGKEVKSYCKECSDKEQHEKSQARYDKAKKVPWLEYDGTWLCCDHCDEYFADVDELLDAHEDNAELPTWAWGTYRQDFTLDAESIIEHGLDEFHDGAGEDIGNADVKELQTFLDAWCKKQDVGSYFADHGVVVDFESITDKVIEERKE